MTFFILTRFALVKYSREFVERPSQGTSSLASRLTTVSLDVFHVIAGRHAPDFLKSLSFRQSMHVCVFVCVYVHPRGHK